MAEAIGPQFELPHADQWLTHLGPEWPNLRAVAGWALKQGNPDLVLRLVSSLYGAINGFSLGDSREARRWLDTALGMSQGVDVGLRIDALCIAATCAAIEGDLVRAEALAAQGLLLAESHGDQRREGDALHGLALAAFFRGDLEQAEKHFLQVLDLRRAGDERARMGLVLSFLADIALWQDDVGRAVAIAEEAGVLLAEVGDQPHSARLVGTLGGIALGLGDLREAAQHYRDFHTWGTSFGDVRVMAGALAGFAAVAFARGQSDVAGRLLGAAAAQLVTRGAQFMLHHPHYERTRAATQASLPARVFTTAWDTGQRLQPTEIEADIERILATVGAGAAPVADQESAANLTPREREVLRLLVQGRTDQEIADVLFVSRRTVTTHTSHLFAKLGVPNRVEATALAVREDLI
jgi:DNA-binding CsgD family transcriptional regulator